MKQKIVIKVQMTCDKCRSKAMALVAATGGVDSVALAGEGKDQVVVIGDGVDSVKLTSLLRKKVGPAQLVQVGDAKKEEEKKQPAAVVEYRHPWHYYKYAPQPASVVYQHHAGVYPYEHWKTGPLHQEGRNEAKDRDQGADDERQVSVQGHGVGGGDGRGV